MSDTPAALHHFSRRAWVLIILLGVMLIGVAVVRMVIGDVSLMDQPQAFMLRGHRLAIAMIVGAALSVAGVLLQALLRNPLASPYILGISSGAALGVFAARVGYLAALAWAAQQVGALGGGLATLVVIYLLAQKRGHIDPLGLLLVGVIVNAFNGAAIMFINYLDPHGMGVELMKWMMGHIDENLPRAVVAFSAVIVLLSVAAAARLGRSIDVATFSDAEAHAMGLNLSRLRLGMFALAGVLTAVSVWLAGPVGFVGLICPHAMRMLLGPSHVPLIITSAMAGAVLVVAADTLVKLTDLGQGMMPVGVLMVLIGGPVFLVMLRGQLGRSNA
jgi:iron complex transport system permease protein